MANHYIRNTVTMKAAPIDEREDFIEANPGGKFVYFDADTGELLPDPDAQEPAVETPSAPVSNASPLAPEEDEDDDA